MLQLLYFSANVLAVFSLNLMSNKVCVVSKCESVLNISESLLYILTLWGISLCLVRHGKILCIILYINACIMIYSAVQYSIIMQETLTLGVIGGLVATLATLTSEPQENKQEYQQYSHYDHHYHNCYDDSSNGPSTEAIITTISSRGHRCCRCCNCVKHNIEKETKSLVIVTPVFSR